MTSPAFQAGLKAAHKPNPRKLNKHALFSSERDDWFNGYWSVPKPAEKQAKEIDLTIPKFLHRPSPNFNAPLPAFVLADLNRKREWAPMRDNSIGGIMARIDALIVNREAPVTVWARDVQRVQFDNYAAFIDWYRPSIGRFLGANSQETFTDIALDDYKPPSMAAALKPGRKPRGPKAEGAAGLAGEPKPRKERAAKAFDVAGEGKPVAIGSSLEKILRLMIAGKHTMDEIVEKSGVEGGVLSAEDKVLHRIKFVLYRHHGVGHTIDGSGIVRAVLPLGEAAMFKQGKGKGK